MCKTLLPAVAGYERFWRLVGMVCVFLFFLDGCLEFFFSHVDFVAVVFCHIFFFGTSSTDNFYLFWLIFLGLCSQSLGLCAED